MIRYVIGDATDPQDPHDNAPWGRVIAHCCNDEGAWGSGFVMALSKKWRSPEKVYNETMPLRLGDVQFVPVDWTVNANPAMVYRRERFDQFTIRELNRAQWVANIIGQHETRRTTTHPIRYDAIFEGLVKINEFCRATGTQSTLHMPRMGAGLAGGSWAVIEALINEACPTLDVTVYDLPDNPIPVNA